MSCRIASWYPLSEHIRVYCISDLNQDAVLLADINGRLVFNRTDASDHGWENHVRSIIKRYPVSFMMGLSSRYGDADMINFFHEDGSRIAPSEVTPAIGKRNANRTETVGAKYFIPFSSMHTYQREDSAWANIYHTSLDDYRNGFESDKCQMLPAYVRYDCMDDSWEEIRPRELPIEILPASLLAMTGTTSSMPRIANSLAVTSRRSDTSPHIWITSTCA